MKILTIGLCVCGICTGIQPAVASTAACVAGTYASYQALSGGCSISDATFTNFSGLTSVDSLGLAPLNASEIAVIPSGTPTDAPVTLSSPGEIFSFGLNFQILAAPSALTGVQMSSSFSNTAPGGVSTTKTAQPEGGSPSAPSTVSDGGVSNPMGTYSGAMIPVNGLGTFLTTDTTSLPAQTGTVSQAGFVNSFALAPAAPPTAAAVPEVGSLALIGSGVIFLSLVARSTRQRKIVRSESL